jgi:hypothetical protein
MDGINRVFAHYLPTIADARAPKAGKTSVPTVFQPASDGTVVITLIHPHLGDDRKYYRAAIRERAFPNETEQDVLDRWFTRIHNDNSTKFPACWKQFLRIQPKQADGYEWYTGDMHQLQKPWRDQEVVVFKDPNRSSIEPKPPSSRKSNDDTTGARSGSGSGSRPDPTTPELPGQGSLSADGAT